MLQTMTPQAVGEQLCQAFFQARRRWRRFTGRVPRRARSQNRSQRKGGKGGPGSQQPRYLCGVCNAKEDLQDAYFKGKGQPKGGSGSGERLNPTDKSGQIMTCGICGSKYNFRAKCPKNQQQGRQFGGAPQGHRPQQHQHQHGKAHGTMYADQHAFAPDSGRYLVSECGPVNDSSASSNSQTRTETPWVFYLDSPGQEMEQFDMSAGDAGDDFESGEYIENRLDMGDIDLSAQVSTAYKEKMADDITTDPDGENYVNYEQYGSGNREDGEYFEADLTRREQLQRPDFNIDIGTMLNSVFSGLPKLGYSENAVDRHRVTPTEPQQDRISDRSAQDVVRSAAVPHPSPFYPGTLGARSSAQGCLDVPVERFSAPGMAQVSTTMCHAPGSHLSDRSVTQEPSTATTPWMRNMLADAAAALQSVQATRPHRRNTITHNLTHNLPPNNCDSTMDRNDGNDDGNDGDDHGTFVWYPEADNGNDDSNAEPQSLALHAQAHLPNEDEALLVDTGARKNLTGDEWVKRVKDIAGRFGLEVKYKELKESMKVRGVGKHSQRVTQEIEAPGRLENGDACKFEAAVIPESPIPALFGLDSMEQLETVLDVRKEQRKMYTGPDIRIIPGPRTTVFQLYPAESGHLMLPITCFDKANKQRQASKKHVQFLTETDSTATVSNQQPTVTTPITPPLGIYQ